MCVSTVCSFLPLSSITVCLTTYLRTFGLFLALTITNKSVVSTVVQKKSQYNTGIIMYYRSKFSCISLKNSSCSKASAVSIQVQWIHSELLLTLSTPYQIILSCPSWLYLMFCSFRLWTELKIQVQFPSELCTFQSRVVGKLFEVILNCIHLVVFFSCICLNHLPLDLEFWNLIRCV